MTDGEYREFLEALASKYLRPWRAVHHPEGISRLHHQIERMSSLARFARVVAERSDRTELYRPLGEELMKSTEIASPMEETGVLAALDEHAEVVFGNLSKAVVPDHELDYLRLAGVEDPEAELVLIIRYCREKQWEAEPPSTLVKRAQQELDKVAKELRATPTEPEQATRQQAKRRPKVFIGITNIVTGATSGAGDVLLACSTGLGLGVVSSCAVALGLIAKGIDDLSGM